jgi:hypothetical protein
MGVWLSWACEREREMICLDLVAGDVGRKAMGLVGDAGEVDVCSRSCLHSVMGWMTCVLLGLVHGLAWIWGGGFAASLIALWVFRSAVVVVVVVAFLLAGLCTVGLFLDKPAEFTSPCMSILIRVRLSRL